MLAISCNLMKNVSTQQKIFDGECESLLSVSIHENDYFQSTLLKKSINDYFYNFLQILSLKHVYLHQYLNQKQNFKNLIQEKIIVNRVKEIDIYKNLFINTEMKENNPRNEFIISYKGKRVIFKNIRFLKINGKVQLHEMNHYLGMEEDLLNDELSLLIKAAC